MNTKSPIIIKVAQDGKSLRDLVKQAQEIGVQVSEFTKEMLETSNDKIVLEKISQKEYEEIEYIGVLLYGKKKDLKNLTVNMPLFS